MSGTSAADYDLDVTIESVAICNAGSRELFGCHFDAPHAGSYQDRLHLDISGWCVPRTAAPMSVVATIEDKPIGTSPMIPRPDVAATIGHTDVISSGFSMRLNALALPPSAVIHVWCKLSTGIKVLFGLITYSQRVPILDESIELRPIFLYSLGRSGSTLLMKLLHAHPMIRAHAQYPFESVFAQHSYHCLRVATDLATISNEADMNSFVSNRFFVGANPVFGYYADTNAHFNDAYAPSEIRHRLRQVDEFYLSRSVGKPSTAKYFVEKAIADEASSFFLSNFTTSRRIYLTRDPRDLMASILAYNARRGTRGFGAADTKGFLDHASLIHAAYEWNMASYQQNASQSVLVKYEDLVRDREGVLRRIFDFLDIESGPQTTRQCSDDADRSWAANADHATVASPDDSTGRWSRDLSAEQRDICQAVFGEIIASR